MRAGGAWTDQFVRDPAASDMSAAAFISGFGTGAGREWEREWDWCLVACLELAIGHDVVHGARSKIGSGKKFTFGQPIKQSFLHPHGLKTASKPPSARSSPPPWQTPPHPAHELFHDPIESPPSDIRFPASSSPPCARSSEHDEQPQDRYLYTALPATESDMPCWAARCRNRRRRNRSLLWCGNIGDTSYKTGRETGRALTSMNVVGRVE